MESRKKAIEGIINNFNVIKHRMYMNTLATSQTATTPSQWFVLDIISKNANVGIKEISQMLSISSSAATQLVNGLVGLGYVTRMTNEKDKRGLDLQLSKKGTTQIASMRKKYVKMAEGFFSALDEKELSQYLALQRKICSHIIKK
jgi:MarR family transcriptional regulator, organic hydroperoxide resistance regulator